MRKKKAFFLSIPSIAFAVFYIIANTYYVPTRVTGYPDAEIPIVAIPSYTKPLAPFIPLAFVLAVVATLLLVFRKVPAS